tara:strand:- start:3255 stop:4124 length:870 start_codon:yes stop_codon:yes gene_type:complete
MNSVSKKNTANFFWHGGNLSIYEFVCLKSFLKNGFKVVVYSFEKLKLPKNVKNKNAHIILKRNEYKKFIHGGKKSCLAAYSDKFRILLQKKKLGWWFDLDIICLKNSEKFNKLEENKKIIIGYETENKVNNAVLKINSRKITKDLLNKVKEQGYKFEWGKIGPTLFNNYLHNNNLETEILENYYFYPINYKNIEIFFNPKKTSVALKLTKKSYTIHLYNQIINRIGIPKNIMPPKGSYLYNKMIEICPEYKKLQSLPMETFDKLLYKKNGFKDNLFDLIPSFLRAFSRY